MSSPDRGSSCDAFLTLAMLRDVQREFDHQHFTGAPDDNLDSKRRHIAFHVSILAAKLARVEERADHGSLDLSIVREEVIPDLLVYAAQLADLTGVDLAAAHSERLEGLRRRAVGAASHESTWEQSGGSQ